MLDDALLRHRVAACLPGPHTLVLANVRRVHVGLGTGAHVDGLALLAVIALLLIGDQLAALLAIGAAEKNVLIKCEHRGTRTRCALVAQW